MQWVLGLSRSKATGSCRWALTQSRAEVNPSNAELNPICHLLALLGAHHILHVSRVRVKEYSYTSTPLLDLRGLF